MPNNDVCAQTSINLTHLDGALEDVEDEEEQTLLMSLDIYSEAIFRIIYQDGQLVAAVDEISPEDLGHAFAGLDTGTGILPPNALFYRQSGGEYHIAVYLPASVRSLRIEHPTAPPIITIPLPPLVFVGQRVDYHVYALATEKWPTAGTSLYRAPFPNVSENGRICHGSVGFPVCRPETIRQAANLFFESRFNQDLARGKSQKGHNESIIGLWRDLEADDMYPLDDLVETQWVLGDLLRR